MAVKIRLSRFGKKGQPTYRIVVIDESKKRDGKYLENLGFYNPNLKPPLFRINKEKYGFWLKRGAIPSEGLKKILKNEGIS